MSPRVRFLVRLVVAAAFLALIFGTADLGQLSVTWGPRLLTGVAGAIVLLMLALAFAALRWRVILGAGAPSWWYLWRLYLVGTFFSLFLPTLVGGDAVRAAAAAKAMPNPGAALASVVAERAFGMFALLLYLAVGMLVAPEVLTRSASHFRLSLSPGVLALAAVAGVALLAAVVVLSARSRRVKQFVGEGLDIVRRLRGAPGVFARAMGLGLVVQGAHMSVWVYLAGSLHLGIPLTAFLVLVPLVTVAAMLPVTLSGLGVREGAWLVLLAPWGVEPANVVAYSLLYFGCMMCVGLLGGLAFVLRGTGWTPVAAAERTVHAP